MKLQYTTNCALLVLAYLTGENRIITAGEMEEKSGFSKSNIFNAARRLKNAGYVRTVSGPFGGYILNKPADQISIQEILCLFKDAPVFRCEELHEAQECKSTVKNLAERLAELDIDIEQKCRLWLCQI